MHRSDRLDLKRLAHSSRALPARHSPNSNATGSRARLALAGYLSMRYLGQNFGELIKLSAVEINQATFWIARSKTCTGATRSSTATRCAIGWSRSPRCAWSRLAKRRFPHDCSRRRPARPSGTRRARSICRGRQSRHTDLPAHRTARGHADRRPRSYRRDGFDHPAPSRRQSRGASRRLADHPCFATGASRASCAKSRRR